MSPSCIPTPGSETAQDFSPMFFGQDHSFHELFCVSIQLLNKTWKEMRATQEDFSKVGGKWEMGAALSMARALI